MSSTDERLSDLLAERARQGSGVHPTREGVSIAVARRAARRRRKRAVVTGLAGLCLVAGVVGGLTLAGDDDAREDGLTAPTPATSAPSPPTTVVAELPLLPSARRTVDAAGDHVVLEFEGFQPTLGAIAVLEDLTGACASWTTTFEDIIRRDGDEDVTQWQGWLTIEMDTRSAVIEGPVFGGDGYIYCRDQSGARVIAVPLTSLGEPTVTRRSGRPAIVIDVPHAPVASGR